MIFIAVLKMIITFVMMKGSRDSVMMMVMMTQVFDTMAKKGLETLKEEEKRKKEEGKKGGCCCTIC